MIFSMKWVIGSIVLCILLYKRCTMISTSHPSRSVDTVIQGKSRRCQLSINQIALLMARRTHGMYDVDAITGDSIKRVGVIRVITPTHLNNESMYYNQGSVSNLMDVTSGSISNLEMGTRNVVVDTSPVSSRIDMVNDVAVALHSPRTCEI